jgi:predicted enzyme related to lactoylglutathione lyase
VTIEYVTGIGGLFFRAKNPEILSSWYEEMFGISRAPRDCSAAPWIQQAGATVFAPFPSDTDYFGNLSQEWMINFRVANLDRMIAQLRSRGIEVALDPEVYPNGRFARLNDPEGNPIELWEPKADS